MLCSGSPVSRVKKPKFQKPGPCGITDGNLYRLSSGRGASVSTSLLTCAGWAAA
jgi:hypothetical protein